MAVRGLGSGVVLLLALLLPAAGSAQHFPPDDDLRLMIRYLVEDGEASGVALGVVEPDGSARSVAYGAEVGGDPLTSRSAIDLGSLTMTFTATLLAEMVGRGEVALEDPVVRYLPGVSVPAPGGYEMTLSDLGTHRSGLPAGPRRGTSGLTESEVYELVAEAELERPGVRYEFSTLGYALLGSAIAAAARVEFEELLRERVLEPLGMESTGYPPDGEGGTGLRGATGLRSSAADMLRFLKANVHPESSPLGPAFRMAHEIRVDRGSPDEPVGYGFSWRTQSVARQPPIVTHGGGSEQSSVMIAFEPDKGIGTVLLATRSGFDDRIARNLLFFEPPASKTVVRVDADVLREYEGVYEVGPDRYTAAHDRGRYFIRLEDEGHLTYQPRGSPRTPLYAESDRAFYMLRGPYTLTFTSLEDGVRLVIRVDEREPDLPARSWTAWKASEDVPRPAVVAGNERSWTTWRAGTWAVVALLGILAVGAISRPLWSRRTAGLTAGVVLLAVALLAACGDAAEVPTLDLPARPADAPGGTAIARELRGLGLEEREERIYAEVARGNIPSWLRPLRRVEVTRDVDGRAREVAFWATSDYLSIGSDDDYFYVPLSPRTARRIADLAGASLPAPWMVDAIWTAARSRLVPIRIRPGEEMWGMRYFERHSRLIRAQAKQHRARPGRLMAGHKLDVVVPPSGVDPTATSPGGGADAALYGWHQADGTPLQPLHVVDAESRPHFSVGVRLVREIRHEDRVVHEDVAVHEDVSSSRTGALP